jgi:hypothetical protein
VEEGLGDSDTSSRLPYDAPQSFVLSGPHNAENILSGKVNVDSEGKQYGVWGGNENEGDSRLPSWAWFVMGLILVPLLVGTASIILGMIAESDYNNEEYSESPVRVLDVTINEEVYTVNEFFMAPNFDEMFATQVYWDLVIEGGENGDFWNAFIAGDDAGIYQDTVVDSEGSEWIDTEASKHVVFVRVEGDNVFVATQSDSSSPVYAGYWWEGSEEDSEIFFMASCLIWPVSILGGTAWGLATNRKHFAYGILSWGAFVMATSVLWFIAWFFGF